MTTLCIFLSQIKHLTFNINAHYVFQQAAVMIRSRIIHPSTTRCHPFIIWTQSLHRLLHHTDYISHQSLHYTISQSQLLPISNHTCTSFTDLHISYSHLQFRAKSCLAQSDISERFPCVCSCRVLSWTVCTPCDSLPPAPLTIALVSRLCLCWLLIAACPDLCLEYVYVSGLSVLSLTLVIDHCLCLTLN